MTVRKSLLLCGFALLSWSSGMSLSHAADDQDLDELPRININPVKAVPPEPTYFPDEAHALNATNPASGATKTDEAMIGSMVLEPNPAYPERSALVRLKEIKLDKARKEARAKLGANSFSGLEDDLDTMPESPVLEPKAAWLVGPATATKLSDGDQEGCLALSQFSNDFILGIHATGNEIIGMTLDTRQSVFKTGEVYPVSMSLGNDSFALMALGSNQSTIAISLDDVPAFGYRVGRVGAIRMVVGATPMYFSTAGLANGLKRLQKCLDERGAVTMKVANSTSGEAIVQGIPANADYFSPTYSPDSVKPMAIERAGKRVPIALAVTELIPSGHRFVLERGIDPMLKISWEEGPLWIEVLAKAMSQHNLYVHLDDRVIAISKTAPTKNKNDQLPPGITDKFSASVPVREEDETSIAMRSGPMSYEETSIWEAEKDENIQTVLQKWSEDAGVKLVLDLDDNFVLDTPFFFEGKFEDAVQTLMGRFQDNASKPRTMFRAASNDIQARQVQMNAAAHSTSRLTRYSDMMGTPVPQMETLGYLPRRNYYAQPEAPSMNGKAWRGIEGADLQDLLQKWAGQAGVELVWNMDQMIELKESVKLQGSFTDAVTGVLQQYSGDTLRPVAQLNNDPLTRRQTLIIRLAGQASNLKKQEDDKKSDKK